jgi:hypothetical protein
MELRETKAFCQIANQFRRVAIEEFSFPHQVAEIAFAINPRSFSTVSAKSSHWMNSRSDIRARIAQSPRIVGVYSVLNFSCPWALSIAGGSSINSCRIAENSTREARVLLRNFEELLDAKRA